MKFREIFSLRRLAKLSESRNNGRSLDDSIMNDELRGVIKRWVRNSPQPGVLIGGLAVSYWARPRMTSDIDVIFPDEQWPREVTGFKQNRPHSMRDNKTHAEVEIVNPEVTNGSLTRALAERIIATSIEVGGGFRVASVAGLIASKLGRFSRQDAADIEALLRAYPDTDLREFRPLVREDRWMSYEEIHREIL